ncbi:MAG: hypothetical protein EOO27_43325, partial [Comamonadaceae bacterium]
MLLFAQLRGSPLRHFLSLPRRSPLCCITVAFRLLHSLAPLFVSPGIESTHRLLVDGNNSSPVPQLRVKPPANFVCSAGAGLVVFCLLLASSRLVFGLFARSFTAFT